MYFLMPRSEWEWVRSDSTGKVLIDITETPMARVGTDASLIAAISERRSDYELSISVYREDLKDAPWTVNTDQYRVWERLPDHRDLGFMVKSGSTSDNANMRGFLADHVFIVKDPPGDDHWLTELPVTVQALVRGRTLK